MSNPAERALPPRMLNYLPGERATAMNEVRTELREQTCDVPTASRLAGADPCAHNLRFRRSS